MTSIVVHLENSDEEVITCNLPSVMYSILSTAENLFLKMFAIEYSLEKSQCTCYFVIPARRSVVLYCALNKTSNTKHIFYSCGTLDVGLIV